MLATHRVRDLQRVDHLGGILTDGRFVVGGKEANWHAYEWLMTAGYLTLEGTRLVATPRAERLLANPAEREWVLTVRFISPVTPIHQLPEAARADIYAYERATGRVTTSEDGEDELFLEDVARFAAVRAHVDEDRIWLRCRNQIVNLATGELFTGDESTLFRWGPLSRQEEALSPLAVEQAASNYHRLPVFHSNAGRKLALADATIESLAAAITKVSGPSGKVVVKVTRRKYAMFVLDLNEHPDVETALYASEELGLSLMHLEGDRDAYLVQEWVEMTFERRYFVIDGIIATSAGCIDEYTPYDRVVTHSDPRMRRHRGEPDILWAVQETEQLTAFVRRLTRELRDVKTLTEYVIDVAIGPNGQPLIIELNAIRNSGLYAADYSRVIRLLTERQTVWARAPHARPRATVDAREVAS